MGFDFELLKIMVSEFLGCRFGAGLFKIKVPELLIIRVSLWVLAGRADRRGWVPAVFLPWMVV